jgi:hypothetical protein
MINPLSGSLSLPLYFGLNKNALPARLKDEERDQISISVIKRLEQLATERQKAKNDKWNITSWRYSPATFSPAFTMKLTPPKDKKDEADIKKTLSQAIAETLDKAYSQIFKKQWKHPEIKIKILFEEIDDPGQNPNEGCCWLKDLLSNNWDTRPRKFPVGSDTNICGGCAVPPNSDATEETKRLHIQPRPLQEQLRTVNLFA